MLADCDKTKWYKLQVANLMDTETPVIPSRVFEIIGSLVVRAATIH